jgi:hypothetical protein
MQQLNFFHSGALFGYTDTRAAVPMMDNPCFLSLTANNA